VAVVTTKVVNTTKVKGPTITTTVAVDTDISTRIRLHHLKTTSKINQILRIKLLFTMQTIILAQPVEHKVTIKMALGINSNNSEWPKRLFSKQ
jgi:hypothetical protein